MDVQSVIEGAVILVIAGLIFKFTSGRGTRFVVLLCVILALIGLYLIVVRGFGILSVS